MGYKDENSYTTRVEKSSQVLNKYPSHRPFIIESKKLTIDRNKFLVPSDITMGQLMFIVRKRVNIKEHEGLFFLVNDIMPKSSSLISQIYDEYRHEDGFCYIMVLKENVFG